MTFFRSLRTLAAGLAAAAILTLPVLPARAAEPQNNRIVHSATPRSPQRSAPLWETIYGLGYPGPGILADGALFAVHGGYADFGTLTRIDPKTGQLLASRETQQSPTWNTAPPCYGDGRIYCQLDGGTVQAFDARSLEPVWTFKNPGGGKAHNPIVFRDGKLYVGFGYEARGSFLCLDAQSGRLLWKEATPRGQYAAAALVTGDSVLYGDESGHLTVRNKDTGALVQEIAASAAPIRSGVCLAEGTVYFTGSNGHLFYGSFQDGKVGPLTDVDCSQYGAGTQSTPTVYDSYVYLALASGGSSHVVAVDVIKNEIAWAAPVGSNPVCSVLLSDAYRDQGFLYLYITAGLGGITVLQVPTDGSQPEVRELFLPEVNAQPSTCSVTAGPDGTLYYTNASSAIFAVAPDEAYLEALTGSAGRFTQEFTSAVTEYTYLVPEGTREVSFTAQSRGTVTLNGGDVSQPVSLTEGAAQAVFSVTDGRQERTYQLDIQEESSDAGLAELLVNGGEAPLIPQLQPGVTDYSVFTVDAAASANSVQLLPVPSRDHAQVSVYALSNVRPGSFDRETGLLPPAEQGWEAAFEDQYKPIELRIVVTAEDGSTREYHLLLSKAQSAIDDIGPVTLERSSWIQHARTVCSGLSEQQLALLPNYDVLLHAEEELARLQAAPPETVAEPTE